mgnify:FL=1
MNYDVIIIGGGLGGLTAGAKLSKEGKKVLLLEQHDRPGGCATTFKRKDFVMEVGLHEMDGLHPADGKNRIFDDLEVTGHVNFLPVPEFYRFFNGRTDLVMPHDREAAKSMLKEHFPGEAAGIDRYFERLQNARRINVTERNNPDISIGEYLDDVFSNEEIKLVLLGNLGYFHDNPYTLSLRYFSMAENAYFQGRANFIQGGSQRLSDRLLAVIRENGGKALLRHKVTGIDVSKGTLRSVTFTSLADPHVQETATAAEFVANAALPQIAELMGDPGLPLKNEVARHPAGASLLTVYYGFSRSLRSLGHKHYSTFVFDDSVKRQRDIKSNNRAGFDQRGFTFVDYSQVDSRLAPEGKSVGAICCIDYLADWTGMPRMEYMKKKREVAKTFTRRLELLVPGCSDHIDHMEIGTAKTVKHYTLNPGGAVYGFAQLPNRKPIGALSDFTNLHIASAWGKFGGGFSGAIFSGYMTAVDMLRKK